MNLIIIHKNNPPVSGAKSSSDNLLRFALSVEPFAGIVLDGLNRCSRWSLNEKNVFAIPEEWDIGARVTKLKTISYTENVPIFPELLRKAKLRSPMDSLRRTPVGGNLWFVVSNGRFAAQIDSQLLKRLLAKIQSDIVTVNVEPGLLSKREKMRLTAQGKVAGFRRLYRDSSEPACISTDWPHHLFIKTNILDQLLVDGALPLSFSTILERCRSNELTLRAINVGGAVLDLETQNGLLKFFKTRISKIKDSKVQTKNSNAISPDARLVGKILLGENVRIGQKTTVVGPTIIGNNVKIGRGAVIHSSIIGSKVSVPRNQLVQNCIVKGPRTNRKQLSRSANNGPKQMYDTAFSLNRKQRTNESFRNWPGLSYAGSFKRIADCFIAILVLVLFAPIIPFIGLAIKFTSPGPVFFKHKRQGLYGKIFNCIKFRTMHLGADEMQDKLRFVSQVDGPQFKIDDDPRISVVGRFLRETYLDEIPQFINVLLGQMSVIGPRPSPESENTLCPYWRDARLSVRPGITGLWQICRTRQPMKDFQEWIHYDIEYVRNLSLRMDLWICWQTTKKLVDNFISQF